MGNRLKNRFGTPVENIKILFVNKDFTAVLARNLFYNPQEFKTQQAAKHSGQRNSAKLFDPGRITDGEALEAIMYL
ncbi:MAG: hypothetical protein OXK19_02690 [Candidatus Dadabacteria bacterium]|nr:hypothetical protein [Candidatus Dadabacteria bacterium]